ncbi:MAG TPA: neprosin family prolyl endopeptidase [Solirubrobacteraceae bacterium]|nr:neprosin family prolyl endopeptidase [Solirubrobacteraceae bacterium]
MEYTTEVSEPHVSSFGLAHSIDQLAVGAGTEGNQYTIEAGWDVDPAYFTSSTANPHFFIFVNPDKYGSESCYDCHFTPAAEAKITPGEALEPSTTNFTIGVKYSGGNWWIWAGTQWIGYVSGSAWGDHFTKGTSESNYGEVFDRESDPTTQMGDGQPGASANATPMTAPVILLSESSYETTGLEAYTTNSSLYSIGDINAGRTEWHFGGNGLNPPEQWYGPLALGMKTLGSGPAAAVTGSGEQVVVWKGENGGLWEADYNGTWHGPFEIPGMAVLGSQPTVAITPSGEQVVFWKGGNGGLWEADYNGTWHGPFEIPGMAVLGSQPSVAVSSKDEQVVFWKGGNGGLWEGYYNGTWHGPLEVPGMAVMGSQPTVADSPSGEQNVWWEGGENSLYEAYYNGTWHGPVALGMKSLASAPSAAITSGDEQLVFWKGENGGLLKGYYNGTWHGPVEIPGMATLGAQPAAAVNSKDEEEVWWEGGEGSLWEAFYGEMG